MTRNDARFRCEKCGTFTSKWFGRCPACAGWDTLTAQAGEVARALPITQVDPLAAQPMPTGQPEFDRVLGGGLVPGSVALLAGEPGVGKSTLLLDIAAGMAARGARALLVTAEESAGQVRRRAARIGALHDDLQLAAHAELPGVCALVSRIRPQLLVLDSVQTVSDPGLDAAPGSVAQVREVAAAIGRLARATGLAAVLVGQVTKEGGIAGPRSLEHLVDLVLSFEGDRQGSLRLLRSTKNRYGSTEEIGCFEMGPAGVRGLTDPGGRFINRRPEPVPGACVTVSLDGRRASAAEVQALVGGGTDGPVRRASSGLPAARLAVLLAILERRAGVNLSRRDVYAATVGGARLAEPAAELAVALAVAGSATDRVVPDGLLAFGELALTGEIAPVPGLARRLAEAARLGFTAAAVPVGEVECPPGMRLHPVAEIGEALKLLQARHRSLVMIAG
jgi:DNA repair protein RadA/Sms